MATVTTVDVQGMVQAQSDFQSAVDKTATAYSAVSENQATLAAVWTGEAASTFGLALTQYLEDLAAVRQELDGMLGTLEANTGEYHRAHSTTSEAASSFRAQVSPLSGL